MTQAELAEKTGVSRQEVQNWEAGRRDARGRQADIAAALDVSEKDLLDFDGPMPPPLPKKSSVRDRRIELKQ